MIDLDRMDEQLALAVTEVPGPAPVVRAPMSVPELLELGLLEEADARIAAAADRRDGLTWATMRALLGGRQDEARTGMEDLLGLARATDDTEALDRYWAQRFWAAFEWGTDAERHDVLDRCRERAYCFDDLQWWGNLALLLAAMGKQDESTRAFDATQALVAGVARDALWLDVVTNLMEAAALLGDTRRAAAVHRSLHWPDGRLVVTGAGVVCKGSVERYRALGHAALGERAEAAKRFRSAEAAHRALGAGPLLARTLQQASGALVAA